MPDDLRDLRIEFLYIVVEVSVLDSEFDKDKKAKDSSSKGSSVGSFFMDLVASERGTKAEDGSGVPETDAPSSGAAASTPSSGAAASTPSSGAVQPADLAGQVDPAQPVESISVSDASDVSFGFEIDSDEAAPMADAHATDRDALPDTSEEDSGLSLSLDEGDDSGLGDVGAEMPQPQLPDEAPDVSGLSLDDAGGGSEEPVSPPAVSQGDVSEVAESAPSQEGGAVNADMDITGFETPQDVVTPAHLVAEPPQDTGFEVSPLPETSQSKPEAESTSPVVPESQPSSQPLQPESDLSPQPSMSPPPQGGEMSPDSVDIGGGSFSQDESEERRRRIGDELVERGVITKDQLNVALQHKKITGEMLGSILVELGFIDQSVLLDVLAEDAGVGVFDSKNVSYDSDLLKMFDKNVARKLSALPVYQRDNEYFFAMSDPQDVVALDTIRRHLPRGARLRPLLTSPAEISEAIDTAYGYASSIKQILSELEEGEVVEDLTTLDEKDMFSHPIVRLVNALVFDAVKMGVSDLHFEPEENFVRLRYRLDGVLFTSQTLHKQHWNGIAQRLKIMSQMDIADKISPQDGRFNLEVAGREADFRVSSLPTVHGENIVLRVLDKSASIMPMEALGFSEENREKIRKVQAKPEGIIIVTGPTGSGKTTSLYSMLNEINDVEVNIQTLEDPVEYSLPMIRQTHVREGVLEFADGIKALLRQDPDIIFIGEIRDKTTAEMALKAAMTGHQVYTSLHTNDSFGALPRLLDLGLKPGMLAGAIVAVFAQRLARRLCSDCKQPWTPNDEERALLGFEEGDALPEMFSANPEGCPKCAHGYKGRVALVEILTFDNELNDLVARSAPMYDLRKMADEKGFKSMADDALLKIKDGLTDIAAVSKVVDLTKGE